jgi:hypothetical protein
MDGLGKRIYNLLHIPKTASRWRSPRDMPGVAHTGGGGIAPPDSPPGTRRRCVVSTTLRPLYPLERPGTHCTVGWVRLRAGLDGTENLTPTEIRSRNRVARSESVYRLRYPGRKNYKFVVKMYSWQIPGHRTWDRLPFRLRGLSMTTPATLRAWALKWEQWQDGLTDHQLQKEFHLVC